MPPVDNFVGSSSGLGSPARKHFSITKNDAADLAKLPRGIYVGTGGDIAMRDEDGTDVTYKNVASGVILPFRAVRVLSTGTTAGDLVGLH